MKPPLKPKNTFKNSIDEQKYQDLWEKLSVYKYSATSKAPVFVIDTPPPTVSGFLHIGHLFSYTQTDIIARYQRMRGKNVFYPMGWDNNGLPTEKRVQSVHKVVCDPLLTSSSQQPDSNDKQNQDSAQYLSVSRSEFIRLCEKQTKEDQLLYEKLWRKLALSVDWTLEYETISAFCRGISQKSFLDLYKKGFIESRFSPVFWDTQFQTAVAQADIEDRQKQTFYYQIKFKVSHDKKTLSDKEFVIATTRPELLPACVAVAAHPEDHRYKHLFGKFAVTALFSAPVPIVPSAHADPKKGTGILMVCTFGDKEDVRFWEQHKKNHILPLRQIIAKNGQLMNVVFDSVLSSLFVSLNPELANKYYADLCGLYVKPARKKIINLLAQSGALVGERKATEHFVKFYEKGEHPLELIPTRQWYVKILEHKKTLLKQGEKIKWHPESMQKRYRGWVEGLNQDWCISRQRYFGVPFPVWYVLDSDKKPNYDKPLLAPISCCPVDPVMSAPADYYKNFTDSNNSTHSMDIIKNLTESKRGRAYGFIADEAVMDTWATSSLSPQINSHWGSDEFRHQKLFPADLRPQAHEIIRTWAFYTIVKSYFHHKCVPWKNIAVSGWVMDPHRAKMSKSKGNTYKPEELMNQYGVDSVRYWAGKARLGQDTVFDENMVKTGQRLVVKLCNAFRFMTIQVEGKPWQGVSFSKVTDDVDKAWVGHIYHKWQIVSQYMEQFCYAQALEEIEKTFWLFCDNYLELVKARAYQLKDKQEGQSAIFCLDFSMYMFIKLLAPFMPYVTEELWLKRYGEESASVHSSDWDIFKTCDFDKSKLALDKKKGDVLQFAFNVLEQVRSQKTSYKKSLSTPVKLLSMQLSEQGKSLWDMASDDILRATGVKDPLAVRISVSDDLSQTDVKLTSITF